MHRQFSYRLVRTSTAPPERLFDLISDAPGWSDWASVVPSARWEDPDQTGVGAYRVMGVGRFGARERVVVSQRPSRHEYVMEAKFPARGYHAVVTFIPAPSGTELVWSGSFEALPGVGHAYQKLLEKGIVAKLATDLVRAAERTQTAALGKDLAPTAKDCGVED